MTLAITSTGSTLDSPTDLRVGGCEFFVFTDSDAKQFEAVQNQTITAAGGLAPTGLNSSPLGGADAIISGNVGANAAPSLPAPGLQVITAVSGKAKDAIEEYTSWAHWYEIWWRCTGGGIRMGRAMGAGIVPPASRTPQPPSPDHELEALGAQSQRWRSNCLKSNAVWKN